MATLIEYQAIIKKQLSIDSELEKYIELLSKKENEIYLTKHIKEIRELAAYIKNMSAGISLPLELKDESFTTQYLIEDDKFILTLIKTGTDEFVQIILDVKTKFSTEYRLIDNTVHEDVRKLLFHKLSNSLQNIHITKSDIDYLIHQKQKELIANEEHLIEKAKAKNKLILNAIELLLK